jgi:hypothetical protein
VCFLQAIWGIYGREENAAGLVASDGRTATPCEKNFQEETTMRKQIQKLLVLLLLVAAVSGLFPAWTAHAATASEVYVGGVRMTSGTYLANGATRTTTTKPSGGYAYFSGGTLK